MDEELRIKLKEAFENLDRRVSMLEHTLNDVVIGSLEMAANEHLDAEAYDNFKNSYGAEIEPMIGSYKVLFGDDYDLERELYEDLKKTEGYGTEGFDEASVMSSRIADLQERLKKLGAVKEEAKEVVEETNADMKALQDAISEGV